MVAKRTRRPGQGSTNGLGVISGYVLKLTREAAGLTQAVLAEGLEVDLSTVQGWESGRRPLTSLRARDLSYLRHRLIALGSHANALAVLSEAIEADFALAEILSPESDSKWTQRHPLGTTINRRTVVNLITWPFTGTPPDQLAGLSDAPCTVRRGTVADRPTLATSEKVAFFSNLRDAADRATTSTNDLFRRQATYLVGFDTDPESTLWLTRQHETALSRTSNLEKLPNWLALRSSAVAMAQSGDRDPLRYFVLSSVSDEKSQIANLNYWAYWLGEISELHCDDFNMIHSDSSAWVGDRLAQHLLVRLTPESTYSELTARSLWSLLALRPEIMSRRPDLRELARNRVTSVLDSADLPNQTRQELASIAYAVRLADR